MSYDVSTVVENLRERAIGKCLPADRDWSRHSPPALEVEERCGLGAHPRWISAGFGPEQHSLIRAPISPTRPAYRAAVSPSRACRLRIASSAVKLPRVMTDPFRFQQTSGIPRS